MLSIIETSLRQAIFTEVNASRDTLLEGKQALQSCFGAMVADLTLPNTIRDSLAGLKDDLESCVEDMMEVSGSDTVNANGADFHWGSADVLAKQAGKEEWDYLQGPQGNANGWSVCMTLTADTCKKKDRVCDTWSSIDSISQINAGAQREKNKECCQGGPAPDTHECDDHSFSSVGDYFEHMWKYWDDMSNRWQKLRDACSHFCDWCEGNQSMCPVDSVNTFCALRPPEDVPDCDPSPDPNSTTAVPCYPSAPEVSTTRAPTGLREFECDVNFDSVDCTGFHEKHLTDLCPCCYENPVYSNLTEAMGMRYQPENESHFLEAAISYCQEICRENDQCSGFYFQKSANGHETCGFYFVDLAGKKKLQTTHQEGSQLCMRKNVTAPPEVGECRQKQDLLDSEACTQATKRIQVCGQYVSCYDAHLASLERAWRDVCESGGILETLREEYTIVLRIECMARLLTHVVNRSDPNDPLLLLGGVVGSPSASVDLCRNRTFTDGWFADDLKAVEITECKETHRRSWSVNEAQSHPDCIFARNLSNDPNCSGTEAYKRTYYAELVYPAPCRSQCCSKLPDGLNTLVSV
eukprot:TRINITY_DN24128_c0_g1_i1.p1 TRINITY_DN24128_c0_g1~~TRINITY_DN24128_c0_g1_i1.p1  ORF type:complete len:674 (+),score=113.23 TRINITY_DN24128_c0_g1_i1:285-2024(+)